MFQPITKLQGHIPDDIYQQLLTITHVDGPKRCSHFIGQCSVESGNFTWFTENLMYTADRLVQVFPKYFKSLTEAAAYAKQPELIANRVYANRMGNGDEQSGDGWRYRGRGAIQLTGKSNYKALGDSIGIDLVSNPDRVAIDLSLVSAAWFFTNRNLWTVCDQGVDTETITKVTKVINGGTNGLQHRIDKTLEIYKLLTT